MIPFAEQATADTWLDLGARLVDAMPGILTAVAGAITAIVIAVRGARRHAEAADDIAAVRDSTVNGHPRPMRYDLDDVLVEVRAARAEVAEVKSQVTKLDERSARIGNEVRRDRQARRAEDTRIRADLAKAIERSERVVAKYHPEALDGDD